MTLKKALISDTGVLLNLNYFPTRGNLFLPVRLLVWADGRGTVAQADSAATEELQGAHKQKLLQLKNIQKYHWVKHNEMLICCLDVSSALICNCFVSERVSPRFILPFCRYRPVLADAGLSGWSSLPTELEYIMI
jgi:hypothetical protein